MLLHSSAPIYSRAAVNRVNSVLEQNNPAPLNRLTRLHILNPPKMTSGAL